MALRVWLPLNGNLENQGLSDIALTNNGATIDNNGKIGKCYKFTTSQSLISIDFARNSISYASWIYITPSDIQALVNNQTYDSSYNTSGGDIIGRNYYGGLSIRWQTNNLVSNKNLTNIYLYGALRNYDLAETSSASVYANTTKYNLKFNTWTHVALTWDKENKELSLYINGILFNSTILSKSPEVGARNTVVTAGLNQNTWDGGNGRSLSIPIKYNDVRLYDHCLSSKEVKELAKGLVLHYKLAGPGQANLLHSEKPITNTVSNVAINNDLTYDLTYASAVKDTYLFFNPIETIAGGETYTLSFNCSGITPSDNITFSYGNVASTGIFKLHNGYNVCTFTKSTSETRDFFDDQAHVTDGTHNIRLSNFKLEKGLVSTPWCPSVTDTLYSTLGYNNNIEDDCSGFGNNGTKNGTITWDSDSPRYATSYKLNTANIVGPIPNTLKPAESITMAMWVKLASERTSGELTLFNNYEGGGAGLDISGTSYGMQIYSGGYKAAWVDMAGKMTQWHHFAGTFDGNNIKIYIDGELKATVSVTAGSTISYHSTTPWSIGINPGPSGGSGGMSGNISDARIYATALSAADILELYEAGGAIDSHYNSYAYEYITDDSNEYLNSQGISGISDLEEIDENTKWLSTGKIESNNFYEI